MALSFVKGALWFDIRNYEPGYATGDPTYFYDFGLLEYNFADKPAASEFQSLAAANPGR